MRKRKCIDCNCEYDYSLDVCPTCGCPSTFNIEIKEQEKESDIKGDKVVYEYPSKLLSKSKTEVGSKTSKKSKKCPHKFTYEEIVQPASCISEGHRKILCRRCNQLIKEEIIKKTEHDWKIQKKGFIKEVKKCSNCGEIKQENNYDRLFITFFILLLIIGIAAVIMGVVGIIAWANSNNLWSFLAMEFGGFAVVIIAAIRLIKRLT